MAFLGIAWKLAVANWKPLLIAAAILGVWLWHKSEVRAARETGYKSAIADVNSAAIKLQGQASEAAKTVEACRDKGEPWRWNRELHKCEQ